jgi:3-methyladenine DNA glycosylase AlkD
LSYVTDIIEVFQASANSEIAEKQKAYMRGRSEYFGLTSPVRREIQKPILLKQWLPPKEELHDIVKELWAQPQRELQYFAQELTFKYKKDFGEKDMELFEHIALNKSWWDTIDFISPKLMGHYFTLYPELRKSYVTKWNKTDSIWLRRCSLIFQLFYKDQMDTDLMTQAIESNLGSKEFFINKAIGWILRNYSRVNPEWVMDFAESHELSRLSEREALRLIK